MTCGQLRNCNLCELTPAQCKAWSERHQLHLVEGIWRNAEPALSPAYEGMGQLVKGHHTEADGRVVIDYYQTDNRYQVRLCRDCLERVLKCTSNLGVESKVASQSGTEAALAGPAAIKGGKP